MQNIAKEITSGLKWGWWGGGRSRRGQNSLFAQCSSQNSDALLSHPRLPYLLLAGLLIPGSLYTLWTKPCRETVHTHTHSHTHLHLHTTHLHITTETQPWGSSLLSLLPFSSQCACSATLQLQAALQNERIDSTAHLKSYTHIYIKTPTQPAPPPPRRASQA